MNQRMRRRRMSSAGNLASDAKDYKRVVQSSDPADIQKQLQVWLATKTDAELLDIRRVGWESCLGTTNKVLHVEEDKRATTRVVTRNEYLELPVIGPALKIRACPTGEIPSHIGHCGVIAIKQGSFAVIFHMPFLTEMVNHKHRLRTDVSGAELRAAILKAN